MGTEVLTTGLRATSWPSELYQVDGGVEIWGRPYALESMDHWWLEVAKEFQCLSPEVIPKLCSYGWFSDQNAYEIREVFDDFLKWGPLKILCLNAWEFKLAHSSPKMIADFISLGQKSRGEIGSYNKSIEDFENEHGISFHELEQQREKFFTENSCLRGERYLVKSAKTRSAFMANSVQEIPTCFSAKAQVQIAAFGLAAPSIYDLAKTKHQRVPFFTVQPQPAAATTNSGALMMRMPMQDLDTSGFTPPTVSNGGDESEVRIRVDDDEVDTSSIDGVAAASNGGGASPPPGLSVEGDAHLEHPILTEALLQMSSQAVVALLTTTSSTSTASRNEKILLNAAVGCNVISFFAGLSGTFMCRRGVYGMAQIMKRVSYTVLGCGLLSTVGMLLPDSIMLGVTGMACAALVGAMFLGME